MPESLQFVEYHSWQCVKSIILIRKKWGWQFGDYFNTFSVNSGKKRSYEAVK